MNYPFEDNPEKQYVITLSDGTKFNNVKLSGNNFIFPSEVTASTFENKLTKVVISDGEKTETYDNLVLGQIATYKDIPNSWYVIFYSQDEVATQSDKLRADVDYLAVMTGIDL